MFRTPFMFTVAALLVGQVCRAGLEISITDGNLGTYSANSVPVVTQGGVVKLAVWAYDQAAPGRSFNGYDLAFDLHTTGVGYSPSFTGFTATFNPAFNANGTLDTNRTDALNYDFLVSSSGNATTPIPGVGAPIRLFDLQFNTTTAAPGNYNFVFAANAQDDSIFGPLDVNNVSFVGGSIPLGGIGGSFTITGVPEPTSMGIACIAGLGIAFRQFRRTKRKLPVTTADPS